MSKQFITDIAIAVLAIAMVVAVYFYAKHSDNGIPKTSRETVVVTDCRNGNQFCIVTVCDHDGNLWDYYADKPEIKGACVVVTWRITSNGKEIIDAE